MFALKPPVAGFPHVFAQAAAAATLRVPAERGATTGGTEATWPTWPVGFNGLVGNLWDSMVNLWLIYG
jgi:hypothetical protein